MGKKFKKVLATVLSLCMLASLCTVPMITASAESTDLKFNNNGKFKIVIFSDIQENASDTYGIQRLNGIMEQAIEYEQPDLVVLLGDNTEMNIKDPATDETFIGLVQQILSPIVEANVPYALVFGNHDDQSYYSGQRADKEAMLAVYQSIGDCRTVDADPSLFGTGTCKIPIYDSNGNNVAFDLFMVDSNTYRTPTDTKSGYDNPHADQLAWIAANKDAGVNSLVFQHIPMPENYNLLVEDANGEKTYGGKKYAKALNANATGTLGEFPCPCPADCEVAGLEFATLKSMGGVLGVFTGHDHLNDYTGTYDGINLTAVPGMTYFNYGDESVRGYGVIELDENDLSTYDYHSVKFAAMDALSSPYAFNVDFMGGNSIEQSGNATAIANTGSTVTYKFDSTLNRTVASFDGTSGYGYTLSDTARAKMQDGYTYEILFKIPAVPSGNTHLSGIRHDDAGFGTVYETANNRFDYLQSFVNDKNPYRQLWYNNTNVTDTWMHLVAVWDPDANSGNGRITGYLNGAYADQADPNTKVLNFAENGEFYIGGNSDSSGNFTSGTAADIAFVRIHDKASSASEVSALYTAALTPGAGASDGTYYPYDEITYSDLRISNAPLDENGYTINGGNIFTYDAHSPSYSAKLKFRWTVGSNTGIQFSFDRSGNSSMSYPFGVWVKKPNSDSAGANGAWHLKPTEPNLLYDMNTLPSQGDTFDIELGRLKVLESDAQHGGQYYVYLKVDDVLIKDTYVSVAADGSYSSGGKTCHLSNEIVFADWNSYGNKISATPLPETYCDYDVVTYYDLLWANNNSAVTDARVPLNGNPKFAYNRTSDTYSVILKYRWTAGSYASDKPYYVFYFDEWSGGAYPYTLAVKSPGYSALGAAAGSNGAWHLVPSHASNIVQMTEPIVAGQNYDIEHARLKVATGPNAGKYYVYFKVNDQLIFDYYFDGDNGDGTYTCSDNNKTATYNSNYLRFVDGTSDNYISAIPDDVYDDYDEVYYSNLLVNGNAVGNETQVNSQKFTYNKTSDYGSAVIKYRWKAANTDSSFYINFDPVPKTDKPAENAAVYTFGAMYNASNNTIWLRIGDGSSKVLAEPLTKGDDYDIEFARIKVIGGHNTGKYLFYIKVVDTDGNVKFYDEKYIEANVVDSNGNYTSRTDGAGSSAACTISNSVYFSFWGGGGGNVITNPAYTEEYCDYDEIGFDDLYIGNTSMAGLTKNDGDHTYTYNRTSPTYSLKLKYRWTAGGDTLKFTTFLDAWVFPFCFAAKSPNQEGFGAQAGPNGAWHLVPSNSSLMVNMSEPIVSGQSYDIEVGRLKVKNGPNKDKYYVYFMAEGNLIKSYYYDGVSNGTYGSGTALSNTIIIASPAGNAFSAIPIPETYEDYDEIGYSDLLQGGNPLPVGGKALSGGNKFTYNRTSPTGSAILKYRWTIGDKAKFQLSFEKTTNNDDGTEMAYMFGAWLSEPDSTYTNGKMWLRPSYGPQVNLPTALATGSSHNVEFARLKVKTGSNKGKYLVYIKIDDVLIAQDYVAANIVDSNLNYTTNPYSTATSMQSNEIFLAAFGSSGHGISTYKAPVDGQEGVKADFDGDGFIDADDLVVIKRIILGVHNTSEMPEGIADFNNDGVVNILDFIAINKYFAPVNNYARSGNLVLGTQEHLLEDETKTAAYIADASATLGASAYRLSISINTLFYATVTNGVSVNSANMAKLKEQVAALKAKGINEILYVTDAFVIPYGYGDNTVRHNKTVPDPIDDKVNYEAWLTVNANAFAALAEEVPEIKYFEPFNEINVEGCRLERYGIGWDATSQQQAAHSFTTAEKVGIMADLCWNISEAVKSVDPANQVTTPSIAVSQASVVDNTFLDKFYDAIESGTYPRNRALGDLRVDNFFTIINLHSYPDYSSNITSSLTNNWAARITAIYNVAKQHNDGGSRVWLTETGISSYEGGGSARDEEKAATILLNAINKINSDLTFIDTVFLYKVADISSDNGQTLSESGYGLFYAGDDLDHDPYAAKPSAKAVYRFLHNGSTDYSALTALAGRYDG